MVILVHLNYKPVYGLSIKKKVEATLQCFLMISFWVLRQNTLGQMRQMKYNLWNLESLMDQNSAQSHANNSNFKQTIELELGEQWNEVWTALKYMLYI